MRRALLVLFALALLAAPGASAVPAAPAVPTAPAAVSRARVVGTLAARLGDRVFRFAYRTHDGRQSYALLLLPSWYGPTDHPAIPLVICPHGRNTTPEAAAKRWFDLPTRGGFAVVLPAGWGRVIQLDSWGYPGQIADLARMPKLSEQAVPYFRYQRDNVYGIGASMGGQEVLLLLAKHPHLLAGAVAFDPAVNLANRYREFPYIPFGRLDQTKARLEVGGTPAQVPQAYQARSPVAYLRRIAFSGVPLELWWSTKDQVIINQSRQAGRFYQRLRLLNPSAPVASFVGSWRHTTEVSAFADLPAALARIGLLPRVWLVHDPLRSPHAPRAVAQGSLTGGTA